MAQQSRQVAVAEGVAERKGARLFVARDHGRHVADFDLCAVADVQGELLDFIVQLPDIRADTRHEFR